MRRKRRTPLHPAFAPPRRDRLWSSLRRCGGTPPLLATEAPRRPPPRRAAPGVLGGALSAKVTAGKIRRKSKDLEASLDMMAASDAWNALGGVSRP